MNPTVRLLQHAPASAAWNMAVDEALMTAAAADRWTLRLYSWSEPSLSLGYFQPYRDRASHAASRACPVVRRGSGGGAILHDSELTYSLVGPAPASQRSASQIYEWVHRAIREGLADLSVPTQRSSGGLATPSEPFLCFLRRSEGDILLGPHKVAGSAQRRRRGALLQHGSILWDGSPRAPELPGIRQLAAVGGTQSQFASELPGRIAHQLRADLEPGELSEEERELAEEWYETRFSQAAWTQKR